MFTTLIEPVLAALGFALGEEHYRQRSFGSAFAMYTRGGELRLIWDGREGTLAADYDSRVLLEKRIDWLGPAVRTADEVPSLKEAIVNQFGSASARRSK